jgi:hypothetical protein
MTDDFLKQLAESEEPDDSDRGVSDHVTPKVYPPSSRDDEGEKAYLQTKEILESHNPVMTGFMARIQRDGSWQELDLAELTDYELETFGRITRRHYRRRKNNIKNP